MNREIDIHGLTKPEAKKIIERMIVNADKDVKEIVIIHGYHSGDALKSMVRDVNIIRSKRIKRRKLTMNQGQTIIELY
ncbi:Smr/MutS family protein [Candidatus Izimaplasma bacterium]|nr:Smr/MutS family protein [Candidatus Izimaplasma bacterium]